MAVKSEFYLSDEDSERLFAVKEDNGKAELTISEGRFHQVKRMFASVGCKVTYLKRISMGTLTLGTLEKATYRKLTEQELASLKKEAENKQSSGV